MVQAITDAFEGSGLNPIHGAEVRQKGASLHQRIDQIRRARFGIYDLSSPESPDTLLELGAALGLGRDVVIIRKKGLPLPEAINPLGQIEYEGPSDLTEKLKKRMKI
jgi:hypothetical protein